MPDVYTERKLAIQGQFAVGTLADYTGQRTALHGTVKILGHERRGGVVIEADGIRATVSPFSLLPLETLRPPGRGKRPEPLQNGHRPTARIFRNGVPVVPEMKTLKGTTDESSKAKVELDALARLRQIGAPPAPPPSPVAAPATQATLPPPLSPPLGKANVEAFFFRWLRDFRRQHRTPRGRRSSIPSTCRPISATACRPSPGFTATAKSFTSSQRSGSPIRRASRHRPRSRRFSPPASLAPRRRSRSTSSG